MKRLVIAIDCDDVLLQTTPYFVDAYNLAYGTNVTLAESHQDTDMPWQTDAETFQLRITELMDTDAYRNLAPTIDTVAALQLLAKDHELHVITARREEDRQVTQHILDNYMPGVFTSLELVGFTGSKGEARARLQADILIDDVARHLKDAMAHGLPKEGALLFGAYPWNQQSGLQMNIVKCDSWADVQKEIKQLAG